MTRASTFSDVQSKGQSRHNPSQRHGMSIGRVVRGIGREHSGTGSFLLVGTEQVIDLNAIWRLGRKLTISVSCAKCK